MNKLFVNGSEAEFKQQGEDEFWIKIDAKWHLIFIERGTHDSVAQISSSLSPRAE